MAERLQNDSVSWRELYIHLEVDMYSVQHII